MRGCNYSLLKIAVFLMLPYFTCNAQVKSDNFINIVNCSLLNFKTFKNFSQDTFGSKTDFSFDTFQKIADFSYDYFYGEASFQHDIFNDRTIFSFDTFYKNASFFQSSFNNTALFSFSKFQNGANFELCIFKNEVDFSNVYFDSFINFNCTFSNSVYFNNIITKKKTVLSYKDALLPDKIYFANNPKIACEIDLTEANFKDSSRISRKTKDYLEDRRHWIYLYNSDISKFHLDYFHFRLLLKDKYGNKLSGDDAKSIYSALLKNFKDRGQSDSYRLLDIEYHDYLFGFWSFIKWWNCYGYKKEWVFLWIGGFLILFTIMTSICFPFLNESIYPIDFFTEKDGIRNLNLRRTTAENVKLIAGKYYISPGYRIWYSFIYTSIIFFLFSLNIEKFDFKINGLSTKNKTLQILGVSYIIFIYSVGLLCIGYLASFVLKK